MEKKVKNKVGKRKRVTQGQRVMGIKNGRKNDSYNTGKKKNITFITR